LIFNGCKSSYPVKNSIATNNILEFLSYITDFQTSALSQEKLMQATPDIFEQLNTGQN
jgi:hypothetical protein